MNQRGRIAKCAKSTIESVGAIINRPRALSERPYIHRIRHLCKVRECCVLATLPFVIEWGFRAVIEFYRRFADSAARPWFMKEKTVYALKQYSAAPVASS